MKNHLLAIESGGKAGKFLMNQHLGDVLTTIKMLGGRAKPANGKPNLEKKSIQQMLEEAARHPDVAKAMAALGGGR